MNRVKLEERGAWIIEVHLIRGQNLPILDWYVFFFLFSYRLFLFPYRFIHGQNLSTLDCVMVIEEGEEKREKGKREEDSFLCQSVEVLYSLSLSLSLSLSPSLPPSLPLSPSLTHSHSLTHSLSHTHTHTHTHTCTHPPTHTHTCTHLHRAINDSKMMGQSDPFVKLKLVSEKTGENAAEQVSVHVSLFTFFQQKNFEKRGKQRFPPYISKQIVRRAFLLLFL